MSRSALEILRECPLSYLQQGLLTPGQFIRAIEDWGFGHITGQFQIPHGQLEALDEAGVLRPILRATLIPDHDGVLRPSVRAGIDQIRAMAAEGQVENGVMYRPWTPYQTDKPHMIATYGIFYSGYQLFAIPWLERQVGRFHRVGEGHSSMFSRGKWRFETERPPLAVSLALDHDTVCALNAIDSYYRPFLTTWHGPSDWSAFLKYQDTFDPQQLAEWLAVSPAQLIQSARRLDRTADNIDPLGEWFRVIRLAPRKWDKLRGHARVAIEMRIAAEVLLAFAEALAGQPVNESSTSRKSLNVAPGEFQATLTEFGLSSRPGAVVVLEGETEYLLAPRIIQALKLARPERVHYCRVSGIDAPPLPLEILVYPQLGQTIPGGTMVLSTVPPTRLFLAMDPEHRFETAEGRRELKKRWVDGMKDWANRQGYVLSSHELQNLIRVRAWPRGSFEFSHFSDEQLAVAVRRVATRPDKLPADLERYFFERRPPGGGVSNSKWKYWGVRKTQLADALWPELEAAILREPPYRRSTIPIARVFQEAYEFAAEHSHFDLWGWSLSGSRRRPPWTAAKAARRRPKGGNG